MVNHRLNVIKNRLNTSLTTFFYDIFLQKFMALKRVSFSLKNFDVLYSI